MLAYHGVEDAETFAGHVRRLAATANVVSLEDVVAACHGGPGLPARSVLITFDDGDPTVLDHAVPVLRSYGLPAVAFVIAGLVDTDRVPWWVEAEQLSRAGGRVDGLPPCEPARLVRWLKTVPDARRLEVLQDLRASARLSMPPARQLTSDDLLTLEKSGVAVENHTWSHPLLDQCDDETVEHEVQRAHDRLTDLLGRAPRAFAYPNGNHDQRAERLLERLGYRVGFLFDHRLSPAVPERPLRISRLRVDSTTTPARFELLISGLHPALHRLRGGA